MSRLIVLRSFQQIIGGSFDRVYVYPEEYADIGNDPDMPFFVLEELAASENNTIPVGDFADLVGIEWTAALYGYVAIGDPEAPSFEDAEAKALAYTARNTIRDLLQRNLIPSGALAPLGDERRLYTDYIARLQYNGQPYIGVYFEIPVISG